MKIVIEDRVDSNGEVVGRRVRHYCEDVSRTKQSMRDECDINGIMLKYEKTGTIAHVEKRDAYFADVSAVPDFAQAIAVVEQAESMFMSLPAKVRKEFDNDAVKYVEFCADPNNLPRMRELGIASPEPVAVVQKVEVINQPVPATAPVEGGV